MLNLYPARLNSGRAFKYCLTVGAFIFIALSCRQKKAIPITEFSQNHRKKIILLDVRTPEEYAEGHLEASINMNWFDPDFVQNADTLPREKTVYVYCKKGGRSARAARVLDSLGYEVVDLLGGYEAYRAQE